MRVTNVQKKALRLLSDGKHRVDCEVASDRTIRTLAKQGLIERQLWMVWITDSGRELVKRK